MGGAVIVLLLLSASPTRAWRDAANLEGLDAAAAESHDHRPRQQSFGSAGRKDDGAAISPLG